MKVWKKAAAFLLCLGFAVSNAGCIVVNMGDGGSASNPTSENPATSDSGGVTPDTSNLVKAENVTDLFGQAKSAKLTFEASVSEIAISGEALLSFTEKGADMKLELASDGEETTVYFIDGFVYKYDAAENTYYAEGQNFYAVLEETGLSEEALEEIFGVIGGVMEDSDISFGRADIDSFINGLISSEAVVEDGAMMLKYDAAKTVNDITLFVKMLNLDTTLEEFIDKLLVEAAPEGKTATTCAVILDEIATYGAYTVSEAYTELDEKFEAEFKMGIQEYKDYLMLNPTVYSTLTEYFGADVVKEIAAFDFNAIVEEYGAYSVDDLLAEFMPTDDTAGEGDASSDGSSDSAVVETEPLTLADITGDIKTLLSSTTLEDVGVTGDMLEIFGAMNAKELYAKTGIRYNKDSSIDALIFGLGVDVTVKNTDTYKFSAKATLSEFCKDSVTIALPEGAKAVYQCVGCYGSSLEDATVTYREDYDAYLCDDCYSTYGYEMCWMCFETSADVTYREEYDTTLCDACYAEWETVCYFCGATEDVMYEPVYGCYACPECITEGVEPCYICGLYTCDHV